MIEMDLMRSAYMGILLLVPRLILQSCDSSVVLRHRPVNKRPWVQILSMA